MEGPDGAATRGHRDARRRAEGGLGASETDPSGAEETRQWLVSGCGSLLFFGRWPPASELEGEVEVNGRTVLLGGTSFGVPVASRGAFEMAFKLKDWFLPGALLVLAIFSLTALILSLVAIHNVTQPVGNKYGMVFDAGSSHTSLFIYQWPGDKENNTGMVSQAFSCHVNGSGISSYADDPPKAGDSLRECLDEAMRVIPPAQQRETPAYLGATAGMRLLRMENASLSDQVLKAVGETIQQYPVNFRGAQIITGNDEGAYGWITINYLLDSFTKADSSEIGWSLGYMLNLTNLIPSENPRRLRGHEEGVWVASVFFIAISLAICLVLMVLHFLR
ncbi:hypothetical protein JRQ81_008541 [Phrynocephalus forsythii]|uniref:Ectonucleoside triphosphate diphosphohydrolase 8 n=1 Tax=Phrynocephalus forsythii TaxID=171643 RepID=A0A9Q0XAA4_9SAUR|nr:hypothetical protein JRQ81_008541 [Phrynocephalus forsythii]